MTDIATKRSTCRLCNGSKLILALPIQPSPIADAFVPLEKLNDVQPLIPLDLYQCQECGHVQNLDIVNPELLFRDYIFTTSSSAGLIEHFRNYAADLVKDFAIPQGSLVVEIGSNDGTLLSFFQKHKLEVLGVDPARSIAKKASDSGIPTIPEYFTPSLSAQIQKILGAPN